MITAETILQPLNPKCAAIDTARELYRKWNAPVSFQEDFDHYLKNGVVTVRPDLFGLYKLILSPVTNKPAWFVRMAVGDLQDLISCLPFYLPEICFCRKQNGRIRVYPLLRVVQLVAARKSKLKREVTCKYVSETV